MKGGRRVAAVIPALDEEASIGPVVAGLPVWLDRIVAVDNGSLDRTAYRARLAGAEAVSEPRRGYGAACLAGLAAAGDCDIVVFTDVDGSDDPADMAALVRPVLEEGVELAVGSRVLEGAAPRALGPAQRFGNALACAPMRRLWRARFTDLGPYRAVARDALERLRMGETTMGWTVEMQVKAASAGLRVREVPVACRKRRAGRSKVSGSLAGSARAGARILYVIARARLARVPDAVSRASG